MLLQCVDEAIVEDWFQASSFTLCKGPQSTLVGDQQMAYAIKTRFIGTLFFTLDPFGNSLSPRLQRFQSREMSIGQDWKAPKKLDSFYSKLTSFYGPKITKDWFYRTMWAQILSQVASCRLPQIVLRTRMPREPDLGSECLDRILSRQHGGFRQKEVRQGKLLGMKHVVNVW